jgi:DNA primase
MWQRAKTALASNPLTSSSALARSQFSQTQSAQRIAAQGAQVAKNLQNQWLQWEQYLAQTSGIPVLPPTQYRQTLEDWFKKKAVPRTYDADDFLDPTENVEANAIKQTLDLIADAAEKRDATAMEREFKELTALIQRSAQSLTSKDEQVRAAARLQYKQAQRQTQATGAAQPQQLQAQQPQTQQPQVSVVTPATIAQTLQNFGLNAAQLANLQKSTPQLIGAATVGSTGNANADNLLKALGLQVQ